MCEVSRHPVHGLLSLPCMLCQSAHVKRHHACKRRGKTWAEGSGGICSHSWPSSWLPRIKHVALPKDESLGRSELVTSGDYALQIALKPGA